MLQNSLQFILKICVSSCPKDNEPPWKNSAQQGLGSCKNSELVLSALRYSLSPSSQAKPKIFSENLGRKKKKKEPPTELN